MVYILRHLWLKSYSFFASLCSKIDEFNFHNVAISHVLIKFPARLVQQYEAVRRSLLFAHLQ